MHALSGLCIRGATAFVHRIGPATLSDISLRQRQPTWRRSSQAQRFAGRPGDTQAVKTTGQAEHACSMPRLGTAPTRTPGSYATQVTVTEESSSRLGSAGGLVC